MEFAADHILIPNTPFGTLQLRYYGFIIVGALLAAGWVAMRLAKEEGRDPEHIWGGLTWAIIPGIVLARLWFVLFPPVSLTQGCDDPLSNAVCRDAAWFMQNFFNLENGAIAIWSGGLSIFGAVLGGLLGIFIYVRRNNLPLGVWLDIAAVVAPLGQAIGRLGNYVNQELYGVPTTLPWGITIDRANRVGEYQSMVEYPADTLFHPLFLYEGLWNLLAFIVLLNIFQRYRHRLVAGDLFLIYIAQYSFIRFLLEFLRIEVAYLPGTELNVSQVVTAAAFVIAIAWFLWRHRAGVEVPPRPAPVWPEKDAKATKGEPNDKGDKRQDQQTDPV